MKIGAFKMGDFATPPRQLTIKQGKVCTIDGLPPEIPDLEGKDICVVERSALDKLIQDASMFRNMCA